MAGPAREPLQATLGAGAFHGLYSLIAGFVLVWTVPKYVVVSDAALWKPPAVVSWQKIERLSGPSGMVPYGILLVLHECIIRIAPAFFVLEITW